MKLNLVILIFACLTSCTGSDKAAPVSPSVSADQATDAPPAEAEPALPSCEFIFGKGFKISDLESYKHLNNYPIVASDCRDFDTYLIGVFAYDSGVAGKKDLLVVLFDSKTLKPLSDYHRTVLEDNRFNLEELSIDIDMDSFLLTEKIPAIGIMIRNGNDKTTARWGDFGQDYYRSFFAIDHNKLVALLQRLPTYEWKYVGTTNSRFDSNPKKGFLLTTSRKIKVSTKVTNNTYPNVIVESTQTKTFKEKETIVKVNSYEFAYINNQYSRVKK